MIINLFIKCRSLNKIKFYNKIYSKFIEKIANHLAIIKITKLQNT